MKKNFREYFLFLVFISNLFAFIFIMVFLFKKEDLPTKNFLVESNLTVHSKFKIDIKIYDFIALYVLVSFLSSFYCIRKLINLKGRMSYETFAILFFLLSFSIGLFKIVILLLDIYLNDKELILFLNKIIISYSLFIFLFLMSLSLNLKNNLSIKFWGIAILFVIFISQGMLLPNYKEDIVFYYLHIDKLYFKIMNMISLLILLNFYFFKKKIFYIFRIGTLLLSYKLLFLTDSLYYYLAGFFFLLIFLLTKHN